MIELLSTLIVDGQVKTQCASSRRNLSNSVC